MILLFILFIGAVFFLYRDPKGHNRVITFSNSVAAPKATVSVMTYNIGFGAGLNNLDGVTYKKARIVENLDRIAATVKKHNPDILCVQEIDVRSRRSYLVDEVDYLAHKCGFKYAAVSFTWNRYYIPFPFTIDVRRHFGKVLAAQVVFSKYPITSQTVLPLPHVMSKPLWYRFFYLYHVAQIATIQCGEKTFDVANLHLEAFDKLAREHQADYVVGELEDALSDHPLIVAGDFNSIDRGETDKTLTLFNAVPFLKDTHLDSDLTYPADRPDQPLDHIFYTPKFFESVDVRRCDDAETASDHLPVYAEFKLNI